MTTKAEETASLLYEPRAGERWRLTQAALAEFARAWSPRGISRRYAKTLRSGVVIECSKRPIAFPDGEAPGVRLDWGMLSGGSWWVTTTDIEPAIDD